MGAINKLWGTTATDVHAVADDGKIGHWDGTAWAFAAAGIVVGHLNILSIAFAAMLFGLGNDFAIVYISHYSDLRERGVPLYEAILETSRSVGPGITTAAFTAAFTNSG